MVLFTSPVNSGIFSVSGLDFIVLSGVGTVLGTEWLIEMCACFQLSSLSDLISPESFLMPIIVCFFLCLLVCLWTLFTSNVS